MFVTVSRSPHQGIIHLVKKLPHEAVSYKLQEITTRPFRNVDNVKGAPWCGLLLFGTSGSVPGTFMAEDGIGGTVTSSKVQFVRSAEEE